MKLLLLLLGCCAMTLAAPGATLESAPAPASGRERESDTVVLLHGLGCSRLWMTRLAVELQRDGYRVVNLTYPSLTKPLETLATEWLPAKLRGRGILPQNQNAPDLPAASSSAPRPRVHFVTHSMGGLLVRLWLREGGAPENLGRVVMLGPPNAGSEIPDRFQAFPPFRWFTGVNGRRLTTAPDGLPRSLGAWPLRDSEVGLALRAGLGSSAAPHSEQLAAERGQLGIIAGNRPVNFLTAAWLPAPNDGKVTVASTHLAGETDHVVLPYSHTLLAWRRGTITQVKIFLREGRFSPPPPPAPRT